MQRVPICQKLRGRVDYFLENFENHRNFSKQFKSFPVCLEQKNETLDYRWGKGREGG